MNVFLNYQDSRMLTRWLIVIVMTFLGLTFVAPQVWLKRIDHSNGISVTGAYHPSAILDMPQLIDEADIIVIGEVGSILAREYPLSYQDSFFTEEQWTIINKDNRYVEQDRIAIHDIRVIDTLKGPVHENIPLLRTDVEYFDYIELSVLKEGQEVLLFIDVSKGDPHLSKLYDPIHTSFDDMGIFDLEGNRAYPRFPIAFRDNEEAYYNSSEEPNRPFFELDKLRASIGESK